MYCHYMGWCIGKCAFIQRCPLFRVSSIRGFTYTLYTMYCALPHPEELLESRGPLQVDLIKPKGASLGISLSGALHLGQPMYISKVKDAGIAER